MLVKGSRVEVSMGSQYDTRTFTMETSPVLQAFFTGFFGTVLTNLYEYNELFQCCDALIALYVLLPMNDISFTYLHNGR